MKLRNKKTGEVQICEAITVQTDICIDDYTSIAELNEEWEDYKPKEPLIKDEKIRQCVRLWQEINDFEGKLMYSRFDDCCSFYDQDSQEEILFLRRKCPNLKHAVKYTIDELCGEEE